MALGPENFNATIALNSVFCFQGEDIHDFFDEDSEPYLWVIMVKIDAEGAASGRQLPGRRGEVFLLAGQPGQHWRFDG